ncbi:hypothetical protein AZA_08051 [Nitrospirillum viridazoti Y2]|nr:hypothetical protein AZA_08051 [Nitrospirillum amazonense Y2]
MFAAAPLLLKVFQIQQESEDQTGILPQRTYLMRECCRNAAPELRPWSVASKKGASFKLTQRRRKRGKETGAACPVPAHNPGGRAWRFA